MKTLKTAAAVLVASALLSACGGSSTDAYCDRLEKAEDDFGSLSSGESLSEAFDTFRDLRDEAPDDVKDDWSTLVKATESFEKALDDAGVDADKVDQIDPSKLSAEQAQKITEASKNLNADKFSKASDNISEHAKSECDIDLGASS
jgi:hypothetical protein